MCTTAPESARWHMCQSCLLVLVTPVQAYLTHPKAATTVGRPNPQPTPLLQTAFRRAVLKMFAKRELMDIDTAQAMLAWPHSGFHRLRKR